MESFLYFCTKTSVALQQGVSHIKLHKSTVALFQPYEFTFYKASAQQQQKFDSLWISKDGAAGLSQSWVWGIGFANTLPLHHATIPHESSEKERNKLRAIYIETEMVCNVEICPMINECNCDPRNAEKIPLGNRGQLFPIPCAEFRHCFTSRENQFHMVLCPTVMWNMCHFVGPWRWPVLYIYIYIYIVHA